MRVPLSIVVATLTAFITRVSADLPFTWSYARQCTPLNVTWTPQSDSYPYNVYILAIGNAVQSYRIESDYQPNAKQITFQYQVPKTTQTFQSMMIAISDSKGNGNSSQVMSIDSSSDSPDDCNPYAVTPAFYYASDSVQGSPQDRNQCGSLKYYPVNPPFQGTAPFSFTYIPIGAAPITVDIPRSAQQNNSYFVYTSTLNLAQGTQFYQFMSDAQGGGSGGGSPLQTVGAGSSTCLGKTVNNQNTTNILPSGGRTASYQNLAGAIALGSVHNSSGSNHGGLIGGIIGAVIGVGAILVIIFAYLLYRKRQKRKRELERKEQPQFVDLDEDEEFHPATSQTRFGSRRNDNGSGSQQYSVSPFVYEPASAVSPDSMQANEMMLYPTGSGQYNRQHLEPPQHRSMSPNTHGSIHNPSFISDGDDAAYWSQPSQGNGYSDGTSPPGSTIPGRASEGENSYILRARNMENTTSSSSQHRQPTASRFAPTLQGHPDQDDDNDGEQRSSRFMQHQDAGPVRADEIDELPPSYGNWRGNAHANATASSTEAGKRS